MQYPNNDMSVLLKENIPAKADGPTILLQGLPGMGLIGRIAVNFLIENKVLKAQEVARVYSSYFPPMVTIDKTPGLGRLARLELYLITSTKPNLFS